ncbi:TPA: hypothetical protein NH700_006483 [Pseudomonas aeruginosa]|uniref:hypothetical protein n=1 Tax=Pseudomonas aeruginosa TaxID=287 RepID=UPI0019135805|nr:hypothetical protein [Pseudomonas aeruginosa]HCF0743844.1 hypothetical protein [Pseudomonas aeruginosa]HCF0749173.1 hypothetical protein [Pseudomonas aeruginosa]
MFTVKNYGVSFSTKKSDIALTNFFVSLVGADIDFPIRTDSARKIIIDQDEKYIYGTVITIKNQKKFTSLVGKGSNLEIKVSDLSKLEKIAEFNFLIINKKNGFGIYQYHHGSCTAPNFGSMITTLYRRKLEAKRDAEIAGQHGKLARQPHQKLHGVPIGVKRVDQRARVGHVSSVSHHRAGMPCAACSHPPAAQGGNPAHGRSGVS